ncbi:hypothetical protein CC2G_014574 [Coprinopsis cinerea AmutBmut pab1-1]|nr:hypothetical protein CC2G_014574 [Coprinopsis cinerea AmutBmut pab1-1]
MFSFSFNPLNHLSLNTRRYDTMSYEPIFRLPSSSIVDALAFSPRLDWLASGDQKGFVKIYETVTGMERHVFEFDDPVTSLTWHPKENTIFVGLGSGVVAFIHDFKNLGRQVASGVKGAEVYTISFSSSGRKLGMGIGQEVHIATPTTDRECFDPSNLRTSSSHANICQGGTLLQPYFPSHWRTAKQATHAFDLEEFTSLKARNK